MPSEPIDQAIKGLLAEAVTATAKLDWVKVDSLADAALKLDPENADAIELRSVASNNGVSIKGLLSDAAAATAKMDWDVVSSLANTVLKLESNNVDALKFKSLASEHVGSSDSIIEPEPIGARVQKALDAGEQTKAEALVRTYLAEYPDDQSGLKAQNKVLEARQRQRSNQTVRQNRVCSNCRSNLNEHSPYCPACGEDNLKRNVATQHATGRVCKNCGSSMGKNVQSCLRCGEDNFDTLPAFTKIMTTVGVIAFIWAAYMVWRHGWDYFF